ncbi:MAG: hypothetical protein CVV03_05690 [Firmicutes bacterium HGW-Firmicutes-8]|nr:MAG: hypothetical protein CVV03_05690 [Firmicutes bacterium HGW-Firmicutes-8]
MTKIGRYKLMNEKALVVGIGNQIRQDDGIGPYCVNLLKELLSPEKRELVDYLVVHQLDVIHCDLFSGYRLIVFIDADALSGSEPYRVEEIRPEPVSRPFTSHIGSIQDILSLTCRLYDSAPAGYLFAVRGLSFDVGEELTPEAICNSRKAVEAVKRLIDKFFPLA